MNFNSYSTFQDIICVDIVDAKQKQLKTWFLCQNNLAKTTQIYIKNLVANNSTQIDKSKRVARLYLQNSYIIASVMEDNNYELEILDFFLDDLKELSVINDFEAQPIISRFMDTLMKKHDVTMSKSTFLQLNQYKEVKGELQKFQFPLFLENIVAINASAFGLKMKEITSSLGFKATYNYLRNKYQRKEILKGLKVQKMYYRKELLLAFSAKLDGTDEEMWFWSEYYREALHLIEPTFLHKQQSSLNLDFILDKIGAFGIVSLNVEEISFLENYK